MQKIIFLFILISLVFVSSIFPDAANSSLSTNDIATGGAVTGITAVGYSIWRFFQKVTPILTEILDGNSQTRKDLSEIKNQISQLKNGGKS